MAIGVKTSIVKYVDLLDMIPDNEHNLCLVVEIPMVAYTKTATDVLPILFVGNYGHNYLALHALYGCKYIHQYSTGAERFASIRNDVSPYMSHSFLTLIYFRILDLELDGISRICFSYFFVV
jgi:hypothetical protein